MAASLPSTSCSSGRPTNWVPSRAAWRRAFSGTVPAVVLGGVLTLVVTGTVAILAPKLRRLDLRSAALEAEELTTWADPSPTA